ncbi:YIP1 family protein [Methanoculleus sp. FWC-SCC3]|uniref:YIP1 family protein n=1 Tax=Methanoculleus methanifontis TaxID=2584086 RepID=A0ABT8M3D5_9EURY|nr:Yip1 family protein [Methanoculleus sp. FWC-SCC3]MDN7013328.1 YIP1 family protein [Methanoculleus sp. FWC-SCC3]
MAIVGRLKGIIINPIETFRDAKEDNIGKALTYFLFIVSIDLIILGLLIMAALIADLYYYGIPLETHLTSGITLIIYMAVGWFIVLGIASVLVHFVVGRLIGGNGWEETVKAVAYSATPLVLLGWLPIFIHGIPILPLIGIVWSLVLCIIGIREFHDTTTWRAAVAAILSVFIIFALVLLFFTKNQNSSNKH